MRLPGLLPAQGVDTLPAPAGSVNSPAHAFLASEAEEALSLAHAEIDGEGFNAACGACGEHCGDDYPCAARGDDYPCAARGDDHGDYSAADVAEGWWL